MLVRRIARPMLAAMFVVGGLSQLRRPAAKVATAAPLLDAVGSVVPLPADQATLVRANGAAMLAGGALLEPSLWLDPLGPYVKVLPAILLSAATLAILDER